MSQLDTYRKTVTRKREELAKLSADLSKEQAKISPLQKKILLAKNAIGRTKSQRSISIHGTDHVSLLTVLLVIVCGLVTARRRS